MGLQVRRRRHALLWVRSPRNREPRTPPTPGHNRSVCSLCVRLAACVSHAGARESTRRDGGGGGLVGGGSQVPCTGPSPMLQTPSVSPTTLDPTMSPTTSDPTLSPSIPPTVLDRTALALPSTSSATSDPTLSPSVLPTTSDPTVSPSESPMCRRPTGCSSRRHAGLSQPWCGPQPSVSEIDGCHGHPPCPTPHPRCAVAHARDQGVRDPDVTPSISARAVVAGGWWLVAAGCSAGGHVHHSPVLENPTTTAAIIYL